MTKLINATQVRRAARATRLRALFLAAGGVLALVAAAPLHAEEVDKVLARVNGSPITQADLAAAAEDLGQTLARYPEAQHQSILIDILVNQKLLAVAGEKEGLDKGEAFQRRMAVLRERALRDAYFDETIFKTITDDDLRKSYADAIAKVEPEQEVRARHILVKTEDEAKEIVKKLEGGADFAELAKEKGTDPTAPNGGDLGYFAKGDMVAAFADAAFALEAGKISAPVQTEFGWHVIKVEEKRNRPAPEFDQVKDQVRQALVRERFLALVEKLKADAKIEIIEEPKKAE